MKLIRCFLALSLLLSPALATTWHVDGTIGGNAGDGRTETAAFATIQKGVDAAKPGDTVLVHPGLYYENVVITHGGTAEAPVKIMTDEVKLDRVILSGAVRAIREKKVQWELVDASLGLYRTPLAYKPTRVLADRVDLLPYPALDDLKAFRFLADDYPGHKHGFAWDEKNQFLYLRLRADGKYGVTDPNAATMAVSPPTGGGKWGQEPSRAEDFLIAVKIKGSAHVILDGFTFETPGMAGVYTLASDLVVRNSWFFGCRSGVAGWEGRTPAEQADRVTVEQCYLTHYPAFSDAADTIREEAKRQLAKKDKYQKLMHWQRKGGNLPISKGVGHPYSYESGFTRRMGRDWIIRNNYCYEVFEALSCGATAWSDGARIYGNRFERICDNAVESEDHSKNLYIYNNLIIDTFEPFSWQPLNGAPLPGPVFIHDNIVIQTPETVEMWNTAMAHGGLFKMGISRDEMWDRGQMKGLPRDVVEAPGGFWATNNTLIVPQGRIFTTLNPVTRNYRGFYFFNNVIGSYTVAFAEKLPTGLTYDYNRVATFAPNLAPAQKDNYKLFAGPHGYVAGSAAELEMPPFSDGGAVKVSSSNVTGLTDRTLKLSDGSTLTIPEAVTLRSTVGAEPFQAVVGPQPR